MQIKVWSGGPEVTPYSWYHQCTKINTVTGESWCLTPDGWWAIIHIKGRLTFVLNERVLLDNEYDFFKNSPERPSSLAGKKFLFEFICQFFLILGRITIGKSYGVGYWYQSQMYTSKFMILR